jgi:hypothetical protein
MSLLEPGALPVLHVKAVRDGEEPVSFGPSVPLADYGHGWWLQAVTAQDVPGFRGTPPPHNLVLSSIAIFFAPIFFSELTTDE